MSIIFNFIDNHSQNNHNFQFVQSELNDRLKEFSDQIKEDGVYLQSPLKYLSQYVIEEVVIGNNYIAFRLQDGRVCRVGYSIRADKSTIQKQEKLHKRGKGVLNKLYDLSGSSNLPRSNSVQNESSSQKAFSRSSVDYAAAQVSSNRNSVPHRIARYQMLSSSATVGNGPRVNFIREMQRQGIYLAARTFSTPIAASEVPEDVIEQCQTVLQGKSRQLIIRELQRTNLDVNMAVNNLLSRDDEADENGAGGVPEDWDETDDLLSLLDHADNPLLEAAVGESALIPEDIFPSIRLRRETLYPSIGSDLESFADRRKRRRLDCHLRGSGESLSRSYIESNYSRAGNDSPTSINEESSKSDNGSKKNSLIFGNNLEFWKERCTSSGQNKRKELRFFKICGMYSDLIGLSQDNELHQWRWSDTEPWSSESNSSSIIGSSMFWSSPNPTSNSSSPATPTNSSVCSMVYYHSRLPSCNLLGEKIIKIATSSSRCTVLTSTGKLASWFDESIAPIFQVLRHSDQNYLTQNLRLDHCAINFNELKDESISDVYVSSLVSAVKCASGNIFWWGVVPFKYRKNAIEKNKEKQSQEEIKLMNTNTDNKRFKIDPTQIIPGSFVCMRNAPIFHAGAIAFTVNSGVPKLGTLLEDAWKIEDVCRFRVKPVNNLVNERRNHHSVGLNSINPASFDPNTHAHTCPQLNTSFLYGLLGHNNSNNNISNKLNPQVTGNLTEIINQNNDGVVGSAHNNSTSHKSSTSWAEMPPPPSPASSTCSDQSGPVKISPGTFKRKKQSISTSSTAGDLINEVNTESRPILNATRHKHNRSTFELYSNALMDYESSGSGSGSTSHGQKRSLTPDDSSAINNNINSNIPLNSNNPLGSIGSGNSMKFSHIIDDEEDWCLKDVIFLEDGRTQPVGVVLKVDGSIAAVKFLKDSERACAAVNCPYSPLAAVFGNNNLNSPIDTSVSVNAVPSTTMPVNVNTTTNPTTTSTSGSDPISWLNDCRLLRKDELVIVKQPFVLSRVPDIIQKYPKLLPTELYYEVSKSTTTNSTQSSTVNNQGIIGMALENEIVHLLVRKNCSKFVEYKMISLSKKLISAHRLSTHASGFFGKSSPMIFGPLDSEYCELKNESVFNAERHKPMFIRDGNGTVYPILFTDNHMNINNLNSNEPIPAPQWIDLPPVRCVDFNLITLPNQITCHKPINNTTESTNVTQKSTKQTKHTQLLVGLIVFESQTLMHHIVRAEDKRVAVVLDNFSILSDQDSFVQKILSEKLDGQRNILHVAISMCEHLSNTEIEWNFINNLIYRPKNSKNINSSNCSSNNNIVEDLSQQRTNWSIENNSSSMNIMPYRRYKEILESTRNGSDQNNIFNYSRLPERQQTVRFTVMSNSNNTSRNSCVSNSNNQSNNADANSNGWIFHPLHMDEKEKRANSCRIINYLINHHNMDQYLINLLTQKNAEGQTPFIQAIVQRLYPIALFLMDCILDICDTQYVSVNNSKSQLALNMLFPAASNISTNHNPSYSNVNKLSLEDNPLQILCQNDGCSFTWTGPEHIRQDIFECRTCGLTESLCCCTECARICHKGHDCHLKKTSPTAYCDCWEKCRCKALIIGDNNTRLALLKKILMFTDFATLQNLRKEHILLFLVKTVDRQSKEHKQIRNTNRRHTDTGLSSRNKLQNQNFDPPMPEHDLKPSTFVINALNEVLENWPAVETMFLNGEKSDLMNELLNPTNCSKNNGQNPYSDDEVYLSYQRFSENLDQFIFTLITKTSSQTVDILLKTIKKEFQQNQQRSKSFYLGSSKVKTVASRFVRSVARVYATIQLQMAPDYNRKRQTSRVSSSAGSLYQSQSRPIEVCKKIFESLLFVSLCELPKIAADIIAPVKYGLIKPSVNHSNYYQINDAIRNLDQIFQSNTPFSERLPDTNKNVLDGKLRANISNDHNYQVPSRSTRYSIGSTRRSGIDNNQSDTSSNRFYNSNGGGTNNDIRRFRRSNTMSNNHDLDDDSDNVNIIATSNSADSAMILSNTSISSNIMGISASGHEHDLLINNSGNDGISETNIGSNNMNTSNVGESGLMEVSNTDTGNLSTDSNDNRVETVRLLHRRSGLINLSSRISSLIEEDEEDDETHSSGDDNNWNNEDIRHQTNDGANIDDNNTGVRHSNNIDDEDEDDDDDEDEDDDDNSRRRRMARRLRSNNVAQSNNGNNNNSANRENVVTAVSGGVGASASLFLEESDGDGNTIGENDIEADVDMEVYDEDHDTDIVPETESDSDDSISSSICVTIERMETDRHHNHHHQQHHQQQHLMSHSALDTNNNGSRIVKIDNNSNMSNQINNSGSNQIRNDNQTEEQPNNLIASQRTIKQDSSNIEMQSVERINLLNLKPDNDSSSGNNNTPDHLTENSISQSSPRLTEHSIDVGVNDNASDNNAGHILLSNINDSVQNYSSSGPNTLSSLYNAAVASSINNHNNLSVNNTSGISTSGTSVTLGSNNNTVTLNSGDWFRTHVDLDAISDDESDEDDSSQNTDDDDYQNDRNATISSTLANTTSNINTNTNNISAHLSSSSSSSRINPYLPSGIQRQSTRILTNESNIQQQQQIYSNQETSANQQINTSTGNITNMNNSQNNCSGDSTSNNNCGLQTTQSHLARTFSYLIKLISNLLNQIYLSRRQVSTLSGSSNSNNYQEQFGDNNLSNNSDTDITQEELDYLIGQLSDHLAPVWTWICQSMDFLESQVGFSFAYQRKHKLYKSHPILTFDLFNNNITNNSVGGSISSSYNINNNNLASDVSQMVSSGTYNFMNTNNTNNSTAGAVNLTTTSTNNSTVDSHNSRSEFLKYLVSIMRASSDEHADQIPISLYAVNYCHLAYLVDSLLYLMRVCFGLTNNGDCCDKIQPSCSATCSNGDSSATEESSIPTNVMKQEPTLIYEKLISDQQEQISNELNSNAQYATRFNPNNPKVLHNRECRQKIDTNVDNFFSRTDYPFGWVGVGSDSFQTPLCDSLPLANMPQLLQPPGPSDEVFGVLRRFDMNSRDDNSTNSFSGREYLGPIPLHMGFFSKWSEKLINNNTIFSGVPIGNLRTRWRYSLEILSNSFESTVGQEPGSVLVDFAHFSLKETRFRKEMERVRNQCRRDVSLVVSRDRESILFDTMRLLHQEYSRRQQSNNSNNNNSSVGSSNNGGNGNSPPLVCHRFKVKFTDEPGEGNGVARSFLTVFAESVLSEEPINCPSLSNSSQQQHSHSSSSSGYSNAIISATAKKLASRLEPRVFGGRGGEHTYVRVSRAPSTTLVGASTTRSVAASLAPNPTQLSTMRIISTTQPTASSAAAATTTSSYNQQHQHPCNNAFMSAFAIFASSAAASGNNNNSTTTNNNYIPTPPYYSLSSASSVNSSASMSARNVISNSARYISSIRNPTSSNANVSTSSITSSSATATPESGIIISQINSLDAASLAANFTANLGNSTPIWVSSNWLPIQSSSSINATTNTTSVTSNSATYQIRRTNFINNSPATSIASTSSSNNVNTQSILDMLRHKFQHVAPVASINESSSSTSHPPSYLSVTNDSSINNLSSTSSSSVYHLNTPIYDVLRNWFMLDESVIQQMTLGLTNLAGGISDLSGLIQQLVQKSLHISDVVNCLVSIYSQNNNNTTSNTNSSSTTSLSSNSTGDVPSTSSSRTSANHEINIELAIMTFSYYLENIVSSNNKLIDNENNSVTSSSSLPKPKVIVTEPSNPTIEPHKSPLFWQPGHTDFYAPRRVANDNNNCRINLYRCIGRILGITLLMNETIPLRLCRHVLKYILGLPIGWHDFAFFNCQLYESLRMLMATAIETQKTHGLAGSPQDPILDYNLNFTLTLREEEGAISPSNSHMDNVVELLPNGYQIDVNSNNVFQYVKLYCLTRMINLVKHQLDQIKYGVYDVIPNNSLNGLSPEDLRLLLNGTDEINVDVLISYTSFLDESSTNSTNRNERVDRFKRWFWTVVRNFTSVQRQNLLYFWTSSPSLPSSNQGFQPMPTITIRPADDLHLPTANTCISRLYIPLYTTKSILRDKLLQAIETKSFGFV